MNGPDHYQAAQDLSARVDEMVNSADHNAEDCTAVGTAGLLHAVLAVAAAITDAAPDVLAYDREWTRAMDGDHR